MVSACIQMMSAKAILILNDQAQCISLKKLKCSANAEDVLLRKAKMSRAGKSPNKTNKIMPGIRKSVNGEFFKIDKGRPPSSLPDGEIINAPPPPMALSARKANKSKWIFLAVLDFIHNVLQAC